MKKSNGKVKEKKPWSTKKKAIVWGIVIVAFIISLLPQADPDYYSNKASEEASSRKASAASVKKEKAEEKKQAKKYNADNKLLEEKIKSTVSQNDDYLESVRFSGGSSSSHISLATITVKDDLLSYNKEQLQSYCNSLYEDLLLDIQSSGVGSCAVMLESEAGQSVAETNFSMTKLEVK